MPGDLHAAGRQQPEHVAAHGLRPRRRAGDARRIFARTTRSSSRRSRKARRDYRDRRRIAPRRRAPSTAIESGGGTAILNSLADAAQQARRARDRHIIVLITDGYDENSDLAYEPSAGRRQGRQATVYVVGVAGIAGISLKGEDLLKRLANETGGRAFFPAREFQLAAVYDLIAADVQQRYVLTYTPTNQEADGTWRAITVKTSTPTWVVRVRAGYLRRRRRRSGRRSN